MPCIYYILIFYSYSEQGSALNYSLLSHSSLSRSQSHHWRPPAISDNLLRNIQDTRRDQLVTFMKLAV
jgi:hypothetical protein